MIPAGFFFSQSNLQDFLDCRRRFQLRHLRRLAWPAVEAEPALEHEREMQRGEAFHHMVHQHLLGVPEERLAEMANYPPLDQWWENYLALHRSKEDEFAAWWSTQAIRYPETTLSAPLAGVRLLAKYDLLISTPDERFIIVDWKTSARIPRRTWLAERMQTRLYPFLLVRAAMHLNHGQPVQPEVVEMVYWYAAAEASSQTERLIHFPYSQQQYRTDEEELIRLLELIQRLEETDFAATQDERRCGFCTYRSLCSRGVRAADFTNTPPEGGLETEPSPIDLDFEQIGEIAYDLGAATLD
ncbi:MAG: PD-(D/E)XK nuclease family protein [Anaerolineales bacterium]|nr:PD-(D/E)XK nuclease family protein [Anaerolineales bacterium]